MVEGFPGLCGPWVPYPICFLDAFCPSIALVLGVDFPLPPVDDCFTLCINLLEKGAFGLSGRMFHPSDLSGTCWEFLPLGPPLTLGILRSYHLCLQAVASIVISFSATTLPFLVSGIVSSWSVAIPDASSFIEFPRSWSSSGNHLSPVKVYLSVLYICF